MYRLQKAHDVPRMREHPLMCSFVPRAQKAHVVPRPSHGQTLLLRYTAHILAELVFDDFLAAPAGGF